MAPVPQRIPKIRESSSPEANQTPDFDIITTLFIPGNDQKDPLNRKTLLLLHKKIIEIEN
jgi:hypothetical protein